MNYTLENDQTEFDQDTSRINQIKDAATDDVVDTIKGKKKGKLANAIGIGAIAGLIYYVFPFPSF